LAKISCDPVCEVGSLVEREDVTLDNKNLNEVTKSTLKGEVDKILRKKKPLSELRGIFHHQDKP